MDYQARILPTRECLTNVIANAESRSDMASGIDLLLSLVAGADMVRARIYGPLASEHDISEGKFSLLMALYGEGPKLSTDLAQSIGVKPATVSVMVKRMLAAPVPLVSSESVEGDGRARRIALTQAGRDLVEAILPEHLEHIHSMCEGLTVTEREKLISLLRKLLKQ